MMHSYTLHIMHNALHITHYQKVRQSQVMLYIQRMAYAFRHKNCLCQWTPCSPLQNKNRTHNDFWMFISISKFLQAIKSLCSLNVIYWNTRVTDANIKITTRLRKVGNTWTPHSTMLWFRLRRAWGSSPNYTIVLINIINCKGGTDIYIQCITNTWGGMDIYSKHNIRGGPTFLI